MRTTLIRERSRSNRGSRRRPRRGGAAVPAAVAGEGRRTLEQVVLEAFDGLGKAGVASCPVCAADHLTPAGCESCGSRLS